MIPNSPRRVSLRLLGFDYSKEGAYFVTIAVKRRQYLFGNIIDNEMNLNEFGKIVAASWDDLSSHFNPALKLDAFRVMPNHVHGIIIITREKGFGFPSGSSIETGGETPPLQKPPALGEILGYYKYQSAVRINALRNSVGTSVWQRGYYEHVIRDDRSLNRIREYIAGNPQRWHLDRENPQSRGKDGFDSWLASIQGRPGLIKEENKG
ncbi:MAG: transposase [Desulfobaccales bacterium]